jgi:oligopeptide/dipeptide ABC transporter ATP-binding protein
LRREPAVGIGAVILIGAVVVAVFAPWIAPYGQTQTVGAPFAAPSAQHLLGLDDVGYDVLSQLIWGARTSLFVGFVAGAVSVGIGSAIGITAGFFGGTTDTALGVFTDYALVIPALPLAIVVATLWGPSLRNEVLIIGLLSWPGTARIIRAQVKSIRERTFVRRTESLGASNGRLVVRHVVPAVGPLLVAGTVLAIGNAIFFEAALSFLGLGDPTRVSWGKMIADAFSRGATSVGAWWTFVPPGLAIGTVVLATSLMGRRLEDALNPRLSIGHLSGRTFVVRPRQDERDGATPHPTVTHAGDGADGVLAIRGLSVTYRQADSPDLNAVSGVDLTLRPGERLGLVGESGCGKSTTILATMGLLPASTIVEGEVLFEGVDIMARGEESLRAHRWTDIAMTFQGALNAFNPVKTVGSQLTEPMVVRSGLSGKAADTRARELLGMVGIRPEVAGHYPHELSGGMRQRAAIAMSLACEPKVLLADEPTTALDVMIQAQILQLLVRLTRELGLAMILVTHDLPMVGQVCERVAVMYAGRVVEEGPIRDLYHDPRHPYTRMLFAATPDLLGRRDVVSIAGAPPRLDRPVSGCAFAPRCDHTFDRCAIVRPELKSVAQNHLAACHLNDGSAQEVAS